MEIIKNQCFDSERALYGKNGVIAQGCSFDGPADGESAFKECRNVTAISCYFNLRYPFWHNNGLTVKNCEMTELCRAALWYSTDITISDTKLYGIKAVRECENVTIRDCDISSVEFGWINNNIKMSSCSAISEYFMFRSSHLDFNDVKMKGKYSFQYITDSVFADCTFETKDAFWHSKNVTVKNSIINGEYLAWYSENLTLENCVIKGTQPFCYCKNLNIINCTMTDCDLAFERSVVTATIKTPVISIKNPLENSCIRVPAVDEIIRDIPEGIGKIITEE